MKKITPVLSAVVVFLPGKGKCYHATAITIKVGGIDVATATKGGRYSQEAALKEFKKNPKGFTLTESGPALLKLAA